MGLLPWGLRVRNRWKQFVLRCYTDWEWRALATANVREAAHSDGRAKLVNTGRRIVLARRRLDRRVIDIMQSNREVALSALDSSGVAYAAMPVDSSNRYRIGVASENRERVYEALRIGASATAYIYFDSNRIWPHRRIVRLQDLPPVSNGIDKRATSSSIWRIFEYFTPTPTTPSDIHGCEIEFWSAAADSTDLRSARWNRYTDRIPEDTFGSLTVMSNGTELRVTPQTVEVADMTDIRFPVDIVYTWVDGSDPAWQARRDSTFSELDLERVNAESVNDARYRNKDELRYSLRSVDQFADFVRHIYIVTDGQRPEWLVDSHPRLTVVDHSDIIDVEKLPVFNSHAIEAHLHMIDGLADHYLYLNDDFFFARRVRADKFFHANGLAKFFLSRANIPLGEATEDTKPVNAAAINGRELVLREFGFLPTRKFKHAPYPQLKTVHQEIWKRFPDEVSTTASSAVRDPSDLALASSLHHYVAFALGLAVPGSIRSKYLDLGAQNIEGRCLRLLKNPDFDVLCINDNEPSDTSAFEQAKILNWFLESMFPTKSRFEI